MVQNIGIAIYTAITSLFINNSSSSNKLIAGASEAWLFAAASLFIALLPFLLKSYETNNVLNKRYSNLK